MKKYFYTNVYQRSDKIYIRGYGNGKPFQDDVDYQPYLFVPTPADPETHEGYRTLQGQPVKKVQFDSINKARNFVKEMEGSSNSKFYGLTHWQYVALNDEFPGTVEYDASLISVVSIDIEVHAPDGVPDVQQAEQEVTAITLVKNEKILTFGVKAFTSDNPNVRYVLCEDERDLLKKYLTAWNDPEWMPDVVTGWSSEMFDIPYLVNRVRRILGAKWVKAFSPWGYVYEREIVRGKYANSNFQDRIEIVYDIAGITQLDYLQLYKKFTFTNHESYALGHIANVELGEKKVDFSEYRSLPELYEKDPAKYYTYNIHDAVLVERLEKKLGFIKLVFAIAYKAKINYIDALTTLRPWDVIIHNHLLEKGIVIPQPVEQDFRPFAGAYVKEVQIGMHEDVVSFDLTALYPSIISQCNISPETLVDKIEMPSMDEILLFRTIPKADRWLEKNLSLTVGGCVYSKDQQGFLGELVDTFIADRGIVKKKMQKLEKLKDDKNDNEISQLHNLQWALKVLTNGLYGALGNKYFRWFAVDLAESITLTGQLADRWIMDALNSYLNKTLSTKNVDYIIAGDTDSVYINLKPMVKACGLEGEPTERIVEFLDTVCKEKLEPYIDRQFMALGKLLNSYSHKLIMKREAICNKAIWRGKKMYILNVWNNEGIPYNPPKLKIKGIEAVRSSTPMACRDAIRKALGIIMNKSETDLHKYIADFQATFMTLPFVDIAFPRSLNGLTKYYDPVLTYKSGCPIHVRAAILYNQLLAEHKLSHKYSVIHNKDKIKFILLKKPNPTGQHVVGASDELPPEFGLEKYIDKDGQFEKAFLSPIQSITNVIGWTTEKRATIFQFMKKKAA